MQGNPLMERRRSWNAELRERFRILEERWNELHPPLTFGQALRAGETAADDDVLPGLSAETLRCFTSYRPNVLVVGAEPEVADLLHVLTQLAQPPIVNYRAGDSSLPGRGACTLIVRDADRLKREEQAAIFGWLTYAPGRVQVITNAAVPLFPLVIRRRFSDALFYRLNEMCLVAR
jgi:hypothetical protein